MTAPMMMTCPSDETLAAFIDGRLEASETRKVIEHITTCGDCRSVLMTVGELSDAVPTAPSGHAPATSTMDRRRWPAILALAAAVVFALFLIPAVRERIVPRKTGVAALVAATESLEFRRIEGRLSGGFAHRPLKPLMRSSDETPTEDPELWRVFNVTADIRDRALKTDATDDQRALGMAHLVVGDHQRAIEVFEAALQKEQPGGTDAVSTSRDAPLLSDLAAAYLARHRAAGKASDLSAALNAAERSWQLQKTPEAAWNRAVALDAMHITSGADTAWRDYLTLDSTSRWADEARQRSRRERKQSFDSLKRGLESKADEETVRQAVTVFPLQSRAFVEDDLLVRWARMNDQLALDLAEKIGRRLASESGEHAVADTIAAVRKASPEQTARFRTAFEAFGDARRLYRDLQTEQATVAFERAIELAAATPLATRATVFQAGLAFNARRFKDALARVREVEKRCTSGRYPTILGQALWIKGLISGSMRQFSVADTAYRQARTLFAGSNEMVSVAALDMLLAENERFAGNVESAWNTLMAALAASASIDSSSRGYILVAEAGRTADASGHPYAALRIYGAAAALSKAHGAPQEWADVSNIRAEAALKLGLTAEARRYVEEATSAAASIKDQPTRNRVELDLEVIRGAVLTETDPRTAAALLERAVSRFREQKNHSKMARALLAQAKAELALSDAAAAEQTLDGALIELERQRAEVGSGAGQVMLLELARPIANELVTLLWNERRYAEALATTERVRGRVLRDLIRRGERASKRPPARVDGIQVVYYSLPDRLLIWTIVDGDVRAAARDLSAASLARSVSQLTAAIESADDTSCRSVLKQLHSILIEPAQIPKRDRDLVVVPDGPLQRVPFGALIDATTGRYLIQDMAVRVAPAVGWTRRRDTRKAGQSRFLVIAAAGGEDRLSAVEGDIAAIRQAFPDANVTIDRSPTPESFTASAGSASHLHFAGHAAAYRSGVHGGRLLFDSSAEGVLEAETIAALTLNDVALVTLAACESAAGAATTEGSMSIARAFLAAGAGSVVGTLWPVEDEIAAGFSTVFYRELEKSGDAAAAVRAAQLNLMSATTSTSPAQWAAFQVVGSGT